MNMDEVLKALKSIVHRACLESKPLVIMTCGIAGSGKSTLSKAILASEPGFSRLSIDKLIYDSRGLYNIDYPPSEYTRYQQEAVDRLDSHLVDLLREKKDVIIDRSFYSRQDRRRYETIIEEEGGNWALVYLRAPSKEFLWERICKRKAGQVNADSAFEITEEILSCFWDGFEAPQGEGEIVVDISSL